MIGDLGASSIADVLMTNKSISQIDLCNIYNFISEKSNRRQGCNRNGKVIREKQNRLRITHRP